MCTRTEWYNFLWPLLQDLAMAFTLPLFLTILIPNTAIVTIVPWLLIAETEGASSLGVGNGH